MTQNSLKLGVKDTYIKLIPKYTYFMHKLHRAINNFYLLYGAWNENARISSQNSSFSATAVSPVSFRRTGLCCRSLIDEGLAPIFSQNWS